MSPSFVMIKFFLDFSVSEGFVSNVCWGHVVRVRMSGDWYVPFGWFPASAATISGSHLFSLVQVLNYLPWLVWPPVKHTLFDGTL